MSLYSDIQFGAAAALPAAGMANVVNGIMSVRVEEAEMPLFVTFQGAILGGGAGALTMQFAVDGSAASALPLFSFTFLGTERINVQFTQYLRLSKGEHKIALQANDVATAGHTIDGGVVDSRLIAVRDSNSATLAHGVNSKVQAIF